MADHEQWLIFVLSEDFYARNKRESGAVAIVLDQNGTCRTFKNNQVDDFENALISEKTTVIFLNYTSATIVQNADKFKEIIKGKIDNKLNVNIWIHCKANSTPDDKRTNSSVISEKTLKESLKEFVYDEDFFELIKEERCFPFSFYWFDELGNSDGAEVWDTSIRTIFEQVKTDNLNFESILRIFNEAKESAKSHFNFGLEEDIEKLQKYFPLYIDFEGLRKCPTDKFCAYRDDVYKSYANNNKKIFEEPINKEISNIVNIYESLKKEKTQEEFKTASDQFIRWFKEKSEEISSNIIKPKSPTNG